MPSKVCNAGYNSQNLFEGEFNAPRRVRRVLLTISTAAELAILYLVFKEGSKVVANVNEIRDATTGTVYGQTDDLPVGSRVFVLEPVPGVPREKWGYSSLVYVIREVDKVRNSCRRHTCAATTARPDPNR